MRPSITVWRCSLARLFLGLLGTHILGRGGGILEDLECLGDVADFIAAGSRL